MIGPDESSMSSKPKRNNPFNADGLLVIDKPAGWTSHDVVQRVKYLLGARKVGHTGTLDPLATGVLVLCVNRATQWAGRLSETSKAYRAEVALGRSTDTGDADGRTVDVGEVPPLSRESILDVLAALTGVIRQQVPRYSAVKVAGRPLYRWARAGKDVARPVREVCLYRLELEDLRPTSLQLLVECSKGTYLRALAEDIGSGLGVPAHLATLRRLRVGPYHLSQAISLEELEQKVRKQKGALPLLAAPECVKSFTKGE